MNSLLNLKNNRFKNVNFITKHKHTKAFVNKYLAANPRTREIYVNGEEIEIDTDNLLVSGGRMCS